MSAIIKKELRSYFTSVVGYILLAGFVFFNAQYFSFFNVRNSYPDYSYVIGNTSIIFLIMVPILTMRLFAEETRQKTDQLLYTAPVGIWKIVLGKYFSAVIFIGLALCVTLLFPLSLTFFGEVPFAPIFSGLIGFFLLGCAFVSVGLFFSALTENQILAAFVTFIALFLSFIISALTSAAPADTATSVVFVCALCLAFCYFLYDATKNIYAAFVCAFLCAAAIGVSAFVKPLIFDGAIVKFFGWFSLTSRFDGFYSGILNISDMVYYITFSAAFIYLTINAIEKRRWK